MSFEQLLYDVVSDVQGGQAPVECARVDMHTDGRTSITLLLRLRPAVSELLWAAEPFQYPLACLYNQRVMIHNVMRHLADGKALLYGSELTRIALTESPESYGAIEDERSGMLSVPEFDPISSSRSWASVLRNNRYQDPTVVGGLTVPVLNIVQIPFALVFDFSDENWLHIARVMFGWNFARSQEAFALRTMVEDIKAAAENALPVVAYDH